MTTEVNTRLRKIIAEGKTKILYELMDRDKIHVVSKNDITAGDGAKHDIMGGKAVFANQTACNVFRLLKYHGVPVAFDSQVDDASFIAPRCVMLPYEVVVRREAYGSYLKRNPSLAKGHVFPELLVEFFLKTKDRKWKNHDLVCDDPLIVFAENGLLHLYDPGKPLSDQKPFLTLLPDEVYLWAHEAIQLHPQMASIARLAFATLEFAWEKQGGNLVDFKVEFGMDGLNLLLADVIDNDSWRVIRDEQHLDKQNYRDGKSLDEVTEKYRQVAEITSHFNDPS